MTSTIVIENLSKIYAPNGKCYVLYKAKSKNPATSSSKSGVESSRNLGVKKRIDKNHEILRQQSTARSLSVEDMKLQKTKIEKKNLSIARSLLKKHKAIKKLEKEKIINENPVLKANNLYTNAAVAQTQVKALNKSKNERPNEKELPFIKNIDSRLEKARSKFNEAQELIKHFTPEQMEEFKKLQIRNINANCLEDLITEASYTKTLKDMANQHPQTTEIEMTNVVVEETPKETETQSS